MKSSTGYLFLRLILLIMPLTICLYPVSREIQFSHISDEQGLSQSSVISIYQDSTGFMWFGTFGGLNRYDGVNIRIYQADPNDPQSLSDNAIQAICQQEPGFLWIGTADGLNKLDVRQETFTCYKNIPGDPNSLIGNYIRGLFVDKSGLLWIATSQKGVNKFDAKTGKFTRYNGPQENPLQEVYAICEDDSGFLWLGTDNGLHKFDPGQEKFIGYEDVSGDDDSFRSNWVYSLYYDKSSGMLWLGKSTGGLSKFDPAAGNFVHYKHDPHNPNSLSDNRVRDLCKDQDNILWIGTFSGLNGFNIREEKFNLYKHDPADPGSLSNDFVLSVYEDRSGAVWFGVKNGGLNIFDRKLHKFPSYRSDGKRRKSLSDNSVWAFTEDESGAIWIGTESGGLNKFDPDTERFTHYKNDTENPDSLSANNVYSLCSSKSGKIWVGTARGLNYFDPVTGKSICYMSETGTESGKRDNIITYNLILALYEDRAGILWIGFEHGFDKFDPVTKKFFFFVPDPDNPIPESNKISAIYEDRAGILWLGTSGVGLYKSDREKEKFFKFKSDDENVKNLNYSIGSILEDQEGMLWVGTQGGGLHCINPATKEITTYIEKDGLPTNIIHGILEDNQGNLWISTTKGLSRYIRSTHTFRNYSPRAGLQSNEFRSGAYFKTKAGEMYFGGYKGFNRFFPDKINDNQYIPPIVITSFKVTDKSTAAGGDLPMQKEILFADKVTLSHEDNIFAIEFAALDYTAPEKNQYKYKLEGFNKDWIYLGYKNDITFTNLDPGKYTFWVMGSNNDAIWNREGASLEIIITPPFWQAWWFYLLCVIFASYIGYIIFKARRMSLEKQRRILVEEELKERTRELREEKAKVERINLALEQRVQDGTEELSKANKMLRQARKMEAIGKLASSVAHDLNNVLAGVVTLPEALLKKMPQNDPLREYIAMIQGSGEKAAAIVRDLLTLARRGIPITEKVNLNNIIKEYLRSPEYLKLQVDHPAMQMETNLETNLYNILGSPIHLSKSLMNLTANSAEAMPKGGKIVITTANCFLDRPVSGYDEVEEGEYVLLSVSDTGVGIAPEDLDKIFEPFYTRKQMGRSGTGLGTAVVWGTVQDHKGYIEVQSDLGKGTTVTLYFPRTTREAEKEKPAEVERNYRGHGECILVVDDEKEQRDIASILLKESGYDVKTVTSGEEAVKYVRKHPVDLLILDIIMPPGIDGCETYKRIKKIKPEQKAIIVSGASENKLVKEAQKMGAGAFVKKPYLEADLYAAIRRELAGS